MTPPTPLLNPPPKVAPYTNMLLFGRMLQVEMLVNAQPLLTITTLPVLGTGAVGTSLSAQPMANVWFEESTKPPLFKSSVLLNDGVFVPAVFPSLFPTTA